MDGKQAVSDRIQNGVKEAENEQHVSQRVRNGLLQIFGEKPVPKAQQVVGGPTNNEGCYNDYAHLQSPHTRLWDVAVGTPQMDFL